MADPYDDEDVADQREQAAYDQEEAAQQQQYMQPIPGEEQTFDFSGQPVTQALPTALYPPPQQAQPPSRPQQAETFDVAWETPLPQQAAPQPQQGGAATLAPYPQVAPRGKPQQPSGTAAPRDPNETFDVAFTAPAGGAGGFGTTLKVEGRHTLSTALTGFEWIGEQLGLEPTNLKKFNDEYKKHTDEIIQTEMSPETAKAQGFSALDSSTWTDQDWWEVAKSYAAMGLWGAAGGIGPGLAAKVGTTLAVKTLLRGGVTAAARTGGEAAAATAAETAAATAAKAGTGAAVTGFAGSGATLQVGAAYDAIRETFAKATSEEMAQVPAYQARINQGHDDKTARELAARDSFSGFPQAALGAITGVGLGAAFPRSGFAVPRAATRLGNVGREAGAGAAAMGGQMGGGEAISQSDLVSSGFQPNIDWPRVGGRALGGAALGAAIGGIGGALRAGRPPEPTPQPPPTALPTHLLALPPPGDVSGPGFTMRRDTVTPSGVPPEHTAALNAAGIGRQAIETEPGARQFRPPGPDTVSIAPDESFFAPAPPRYDLPPDTVLPPADPSAWRGPPPPLAPDTGPRLLTASPERGEGFTMQEPAPAPLQLAASRERGPGFVVEPPGTPVRQPAPPPPLAPDTGPRLLTASPERGEGFTLQQEGAPVRAYEQPIGPSATSAIPAAGPPLLTASRERGAGFTVREPEPAPAQLTASRERGPGFTTEPPPREAVEAPAIRAEPRPSEGLSPKQLIKRLAAEGMPQQQINRLIPRGGEKLAAALDKLTQEREARGEEPARRGAGAQRGEEPAPAAPRGAEAREQPAPTARPTGHKALGEALEKLGVSKSKVNKLVTAKARAAEYDRIKRSEDASLEQLRTKTAASTEAGKPVLSSSEGLNFDRLGERLSEEGLSTEQISRLTSQESRAAALDQLVHNAKFAALRRLGMSAKQARRYLETEEQRRTPSKPDVPAGVREQAANAGAKAPAEKAVPPHIEGGTYGLSNPHPQSIAGRIDQLEQLGRDRTPDQSKQLQDLYKQRSAQIDSPEYAAKKQQAEALAAQIDALEKVVQRAEGRKGNKIAPSKSLVRQRERLNDLRQQLRALDEEIRTMSAAETARYTQAIYGEQTRTVMEAGPSGREARAARERAAEQRAARVDAAPEAEPPPRGEERPLDASRQQRDQPTATESPLSRVMKDDRVNAPVRAAIDAGGSLHDGLRAIANNRYINKRLPHVAAYARQMLRRVPDLELRTEQGGPRGAFVSDEDFRTGQRWEHIQLREKSAEVLLHEGTHQMTTRFIDSLQPGSREMRVLETIRNELERHAAEMGLSDNEFVAYTLKNPHEMHAMLRTSPELHDLMRGAVPGAEYRARMAQLGYPVGPAKSLWQSFVRFIRQGLGLPQNVTSLMDHVMRPLDDISRAGSRFNLEARSAYRADSTGFRAGWEREGLVRTTQHELPSFSQVRDSVNEWREGRAGNVSSGFRRGVRQGMPTEQLIGFNRHLFQPSTGGENHLDVLNRAMEGVGRVSREYGEQHQAVVTAALEKLEPVVNTALTNSSRVDTNAAHPLDHSLNSHSKATPEEYQTLRAEYNALTPAQRKAYTDTFDMTRQQRVDRGDAAMRGIGKAYLEGVNDAQIETMVRQMRTMEGVNEILANTDTNPVARAFGDQWNNNREFVRAIAQEWKRGWINNYVPLHRNGDWVVTYTDPDTGQPGMLSRYTMREAEAARQKLIDEGAEPSLVLSRERRTPSDIPRLSIVDQFAAKLERKLGPENRAQIDAARELLTKVMLDQSRFAGTMRKRLGVHGADPSKLKEAMSQNWLALKNAMGLLEYGPQYDAGLAAMRRHVELMGRDPAASAREFGADVKLPKVNGRDPTSADVIQAQQVLEEFQRRKPVSEDPNNILLKSVNNATMFTYFKFLASPAQTVMNGIETYMQGIPRIGAEFGLGRATTAMARASAEIMPRQFARGLAGTKDVALRRLDPGEWNSGAQIRDHLIQNSRRNDAAGITALFKRLEDGNLIGYSSYRDIQNMAKGTSGRIRGAVDMATDFVSILHNKMEDANRAVTALAAYDVHLQRHGDRAAAIDYADSILRRAQPNFNLSNKPRFATPQGSFGAWGIPVAQFRQHGMWAYSQMALDIRNAFKGADAATKNEARYALAFTIGMQTVLMGTLNWLADPLRYLWGAYDALSGGKPQNHEHDFRMFAGKLFGTTGGELFSRGLSRGLGYGPDVSHRIGMINPLLIPEFKGSFTEPKDVTYAAVTALAGVPAISAGSEVLTGLANFGAGNIMQAVTDLVPKIIRDPLKAYRGETEGQVSRRGNVQQTPEQISTLDTVYQVFGFKSSRQGERSEQTGSQRQLLDQVRTSREAATKEAAHALINGSASERRAANEMVVAHNRRYPGSQIDPKDVFAYRKREVERLRDPSLTGLTVSKAMRPYVREAGAFANY